MADPKTRIQWMAFGPRITELSAQGLSCIEMCAALGIESNRGNHTQISIVRRRLGLPPMKSGVKPGVVSRAAVPSASWSGYEITSDWRDPKCVARDMAGRRFEDVPLRARQPDPTFVPAHRSAPSAGVADYSGAA